MKTINLLFLFISLVSLPTFAQDPQYIYIHGKNTTGTADSILFCGEIDKIDSIDFTANGVGATILSLSSNVSAAGTSLTLTGVNFPTGADCKVFFGSTEGTVNSSSATSITVTVPTLTVATARTNIFVKNASTNQLSNLKSFIAWDVAKVFIDDFNRVDTQWDESTTSPSLIGDNWLTRAGKNQISMNKISTIAGAKLKYINPSAVVSIGQKYNFSFDAFLDHPNAGSVFAGIMFEIQPGDMTYKVIRFAAEGTFQGLKTLSDAAAWAATPLLGGSPLLGQVWYHFVINHEGTGPVTIKVTKLDGTAVHTATVPYAASNGGGFGFITEGDLGRYDNFSLIIE